MLGGLLVSLPSNADTFQWNKERDRITLDIRSSDLLGTLERIATATGWQVFVEPDTAHTVSAKCNDLPAGDALRLVFGDISFALLPGTNGGAASRLFVFRTAQDKATKLIRASADTASKAKAKVIPNELIVRLKPGAKIDDIAKLLGAKVTGRIEGLNAYRLQFDDEAATSAARDQLSSNPDVASVESNYGIDRPDGPQAVGSTAPPLQLQLKPPPTNGRVVIGLIDTAVQPLGNNLDQFLQKAISVAGQAQLDPNSPTHGTAMADTILRSLQEMTKGSTSAQILPVDVYGPNATTSTFDVAAGIVQAVNNGARIINLSLGSPVDSPFMRELVQNVSSQNILLFGAAGNQPVTTPYYPAAYPEVNAVTAVDRGQLAPYANRGPFVSLGAPGNNLIPFGSLAYGVTGTSVSSAFISGAAAGYMDATQSSAQSVQTYIRGVFGFQTRPGS